MPALAGVLRVCAAHWRAADGSGCAATSAHLTRSELSALINNRYELQVHVGHEVKTYELAVPGLRVLLHVSAEHRPSRTTVKLLKACAASLTALYGKPRRSLLHLLLVENAEAKSSHPPLTRAKINSGFSLRNSIVIYRCQEMHKVLTHEMVHFWDVHDVVVDRAAQVLAHLTMGAPVNCFLYESYVECVATVMMCGFCSSKRTPRERLHIEIAHALKVAKHVVGMDTVGTNAWAYYVGRAALLSDVATLSEWLSRGDGTIKQLRGPVAWRRFARLMQQGIERLGGPTLTKVRAPAAGSGVLRSCDCNLGPAFSSRHV
jgi:hypothetical protein